MNTNMTLKERLIAMEDMIYALEERNAELAERIDVLDEDGYRMQDRLIDLENKLNKEVNPLECDCSMCREARAEVDKEEDEMTRTKLCDVYENCWECPEADVCFDAVIDDDTEQLLEEGCDVCDDCDECPLEELCSDKCDEMMRKFREGM